MVVDGPVKWSNQSQSNLPNESTVIDDLKKSSFTSGIDGKTFDVYRNEAQ